MLSGFFEGLIAGFGIAIPVGPIAIIIIKTSMQHGLKSGWAAGMGAASVDFLFAALSVVAGTLIAAVIAPFSSLVRLSSAIFLIGLGVWGLRKIIDSSLPEEKEAPKTPNPLQTYLTLFTLTALNPITIAYFTALILRRNPGDAFNTEGLIAFVAGAGIASAIWQSTLAAIGHMLNRALSPNFQRTATIIGNLVILGFGFTTLVTLL